jgi:tetratricopeptide (TPR) repeat protein
MSTEVRPPPLPTAGRFPFYLAAIVLAAALWDVIPLIHKSNAVVSQARRLIERARRQGPDRDVRRLLQARAALDAAVGPDSMEAIAALEIVGDIHSERNRFAEAREAYGRVVAAYERTNEVYGSGRHAAWVMCSKGQMEFKMGLLPAAEATLLKALRLLPKVESANPSAAYFNGYLAHILHLEGDLAGALAAYQRRLDLETASGPLSADDAYDILPRIAALREELKEVKQVPGYWLAALELMPKDDKENRQVPLHLGMGLAAIRMGDLKVAEHHIAAAAQLAGSKGETTYRIDVELAQARLAYERRELPQARALGEKVMARQKEDDFESLLFQHWLEQARLLGDLKVGTAERWLGFQLRAEMKRGRSPLWVARMRHILGTYLIHLGRKDEGRASLRAALKIFQAPEYQARQWAREIQQELH